MTSVKRQTVLASTKKKEGLGVKRLSSGIQSNPHNHTHPNKTQKVKSGQKKEKAINIHNIEKSTKPKRFEMEEQSDGNSSSNEEIAKEESTSTSITSISTSTFDVPNMPLPNTSAIGIPSLPTLPKKTPVAAIVAQSQIDSDDDDTFKRSSSTLKDLKRSSSLQKEPNSQESQHKSKLRRERKQLYAIQESKRRRREEPSRSKKSQEGDTPLFQKVKRLKKERKVIEVEYGKSGGSMKKSKKNKKKRSSGFTLPK
jgi:hypothetical protein